MWKCPHRRLSAPGCSEKRCREWYKCHILGLLSPKGRSSKSQHTATTFNADGFLWWHGAQMFAANLCSDTQSLRLSLKSQGLTLAEVNHQIWEWARVHKKGSMTCMMLICTGQSGDYSCCLSWSFICGFKITIYRNLSISAASNRGQTLSPLQREDKAL